MRRITLTFAVLTLVCGAARPGDIRTDGKLISTEPSAPPLEVSSTARVTNLNADRLDGFHAGDFGVAGSGIGVHYQNLIGLPGGEIHQNCAVNTGCFPGDDPGLPVTITLPGSYRLADNLTTNDENMPLVSIEASSVTLDLRGFALIGPVTCMDHPVTSCSLTGSGSYGVRVHQNLANVTVRNGSIQGTGGFGVTCLGSCRLEAISVTENAHGGIRALDLGNTGVTIDDCIAYRNGGDGIHGQKADIRNSRSQGNAGAGILLDRGSAVGNTVLQNGGNGIKATFGGVVTQNSVSVSGNLGIDADRGTLVQSNHVHFSTKSGIRCGDCMLLDNTIYDNGEYGIVFGILNVASDDHGAYGRNWIHDNTSGTVTGTGNSMDLGQNVCDGGTCP